MSIETTLYAALTADAGVRAEVSSGSPLDHRIYPLRAPDTASVPYITYQVISTTAYNKVGDAPDKERKMVQFNCVANSYAQGKTIAEAIKSALEADTGYLIGEGDDYYEDTQRFRIRLDWSLIG